MRPQRSKETKEDAKMIRISGAISVRRLLLSLRLPLFLCAFAVAFLNLY
jgi:hypothetical protein